MKIEYNTDTSTEYPNNRIIIQSDTLLKNKELQIKNYNVTNVL